MHGAIIIWLTIVLDIIQCVQNYSLQDQYPGPYCRRLGSRSCCRDRKDNCSVPISETLCYCDEFCEHSGDCCPDYQSMCKAPRVSNLRMWSYERECVHKGQRFRQRTSIRDNCNECYCDSNGRVNCQRRACLLTEETLNDVNSLNCDLGWSAKNYTEFWGRTYDEGLQYRLGTFDPASVRNYMKLRHKPTRHLPSHFNAVHQWHGMVKDVRDQGWCGSSWAMSTTSVMSDRFAIHSKGKESIDLSPQQLVSCDTNGQRGCGGGHVERAWKYIRKVGLVEERCYPYQYRNEKCRIRSFTDLISAYCAPRRNARSELYKIGAIYTLRTEMDIMIEIYKNGPVQAIMQVYHDFFAYKSGVYQRSATSSRYENRYHAVKIVGWGEEHRGFDVVKYWVVANSWGTWWGESGYFRILRGLNHCGIESYVLGVSVNTY